MARANVAALYATGRDAGPGLRAYNVASGRPATVGEMATALARAVDGPRPVVTGEFRLGDVRHVVASPPGPRPSWVSAPRSIWRPG
nr:hypothetical protein GCM10020092_033660 [Actinoplanes digitatis]